MTDRIHMSREELRELIRETVQETFTTLGVSIDDPIEAQKDFQHLREWRQTSEAVKSKGILALLGVLVSGMAAAAWLGFKQMMGAE